jgi:hypothetical protein
LLAAVTFEEHSSLHEIKSFAFKSTRLVRICIPRGVAKLGTSSFADCHSLDEITFEPECALIAIPLDAACNSGLCLVVIPRQVEFLGSRCFSGCQSLESITFEPDSVLARIESGACFRSSIKLITIPKTVRAIEDHAFASCRALLTVTFEDESELAEVSRSAFLDSPCRQSLSLPGDARMVDNLKSDPSLSDPILLSLALEVEASQDDNMARISDALVDFEGFRMVSLLSRKSFCDVEHFRNDQTGKDIVMKSFLSITDRWGS